MWQNTGILLLHCYAGVLSHLPEAHEDRDPASAVGASTRTVLHMRNIVLALHLDVSAGCLSTKALAVAQPCGCGLICTLI